MPCVLIGQKSQAMSNKMKTTTVTTAKTKNGKWIQKIHVRKGALRKYLQRKYGLEPDQPITKALLDQAESETDDPTILKRINLARTFKGIAEKHKSSDKVTATMSTDAGTTSGIESLSSALADAGIEHVLVLVK